MGKGLGLTLSCWHFSVGRTKLLEMRSVHDDGRFLLCNYYYFGVWTEFGVVRDRWCMSRKNKFRRILCCTPMHLLFLHISGSDYSNKPGCFVEEQKLQHDIDILLAVFFLTLVASEDFVVTQQPEIAGLQRMCDNTRIIATLLLPLSHNPTPQHNTKLPHQTLIYNRSSK
jgi:hypothetical protein